MNKWLRTWVIPAALFVVLQGCTVHPPGEREERHAALKAGKSFETSFADRQRPVLPDRPTADDLVRYALLTNAELEARYWDWRAAIEQIPQEGTQPTMIRFFGGPEITRGNVSLAKTTLGVGSGTTADFIWPDKLSVAAQRALERARAAGKRFVQAKFALRAQVLKAYDDYALTAALIRLEQANLQLLEVVVSLSEARNAAGAGYQQEVLKTRTEADLSRNQFAALQATLPQRQAALNALLSRSPKAALSPPAALPEAGALHYTDEQLIALAAQQNPELAAMAAEIRAGRQSIELARLQYYPNFAFSVSTDLSGITQSLAGGIMLPLLRYEAIHAAIAQAQANLKSIEAMRRQTRDNLSAQIVMDISILRDADRQLDLFKRTILPRARQTVTVSRAAYETGQASLLELLDAQRSLIAIQRLVVQLQTTRDQRLDDLEGITAHSLSRRDP